MPRRASSTTGFGGDSIDEARALRRRKDHPAPPVGTDQNHRDQGLFAPSCSVTTTRRRRFLWAAWWTVPPSREPFRKPDSFAGGARTRDEALAQARSAAPVPLVEIEPLWARAWARVLLGQAPWSVRAAERPRASVRPAPAPPTATSIWEILGITSRSTADDLKRAFRQRALATHPDRGGDPEAFRQVQAAFKEAQRRIARRGPAPARRR
jgi:hypothetical protein